MRYELKHYLSKESQRQSFYHKYGLSFPTRSLNVINASF